MPDEPDLSLDALDRQPERAALRAALSQAFPRGSLQHALVRLLAHHEVAADRACLGPAIDARQLRAIREARISADLYAEALRMARWPLPKRPSADRCRGSFQMISAKSEVRHGRHW